MKITATLKNGKAQIRLNGKVVKLASDGKSKANTPRYAVITPAVIAHVYGDGNGTLTLARDGKSQNGLKFSANDGKMMAFVNLAKRGHEFSVK